ncbi:DNA-binding protein inhibitor ID-2b [Trachinotus anak]|uniref:DNA-binding protein inhibitor ID-2b n=1 Tax=Trachinotus anak TaxID=443729 RepID=UPI0039F20BDF
MIDVRFEPMSVQLRLQLLYKKLGLSSSAQLLSSGFSVELCPRHLRSVVPQSGPVVHRPVGHMRAGSPVLSAGRRRTSSGTPPPRSRSLRCHLPGSSRNKSRAAAAEDPQVPVLLLQDMNLCYRLLRQMVPGLLPGRAASRVEILQHVIDYILDLQTELGASCPAGDRGEPPRGEAHRCDRQQQHPQRPQSGQSSGVNIHICQEFESTRLKSH